MPIKFRCEYCRQLMGIAESKAGSLVDCPTCGRTLRVPNRDGTVKPPPKPGVNLADDGLRRALDELAQLGQTDEKKVQPSAESPEPLVRPAVVPAVPGMKVPEPSATVSGGGEVAPNPLSNLVALEPLPPMKVVDPPAQQRAVPAGAPWAPAAVTESSISQQEILASIAAPTAASIPVPLSPPATPTRRGVPLRWLMVAIVLSLIAGAAGGFGIGRYLIVMPGPAQSPGKPEPVSAAAPARSLLKGRLTYRNAEGQLQPDSGASVLIVPVKRDAATKLAVVGFRPNDDDAAREAAAKRLAGQGGRLAHADDDGNFQIDVPQAGEYTVIGLSHFQGRPKDDSGSVESVKILEELFERPEQLIGKLGFQVASIKHSGSGTVIWDCTFGDVHEVP